MADARPHEPAADTTRAAAEASAPDRRPSRRSATAEEPALQALLDRFHAAMPYEPERLRDPAERARVGPAAIPALRELIAYVGGAGDDAPRAVEFEVYTIALGDDETRARVAARASQGDGEASLALVFASLVAASDAASRAAAMQDVTRLLTANVPLTASLARTLVAVDLDEAEFELLLRHLGDDRVAAGIAEEAAAARLDPRNWIGRPLALAGRTLDGGEASTASWRGDVGVVVFWASWCEPCHGMVAAVAAARARRGAGALRVLGVSCDFEREALLTHLAADPRHDWPQLFDDLAPGWHELAFACDVRLIPTAFVVGRDGVVVDVVTRAEDLERALERAFAARPR